MDSTSGHEGDQAEITSPVYDVTSGERWKFRILLWAEAGEAAPQLTVYITSEAGYPEQILFVNTTDDSSVIYR